jgi:DNA-binding response OmpR family regulator
VNPVLPRTAFLPYAFRLMENSESLPAREPAVARTRSETNPILRVLVVDDDVTIRRLSKAMLIYHGFDVDAAEDGAAGLAALYAKQYDLLITANNMPKVTGVELVKKLRSDRVEMPVILVSGLIPDELSRNPGMLDATLLKPFTTAELLETVNKVLRGAENPHERIHPQPTTELQPSTAASEVRRFQSVLP